MQRRFSTALVLPFLLGSADLSAQTQLTTVRVASGFSSPTYATAAPGDRERIFVTEQSTGRIRIARNGVINATPFLNILTRIRSGGERGLLGLAFHPDYQQNGFFYVSYTRAGDGASIIERFQRSTPDTADINSGLVMYGPVAQPYSNHNGGGIQFGPDGYLYFGLGDGGSGGDPSCFAQRTSSALGKMLRLDVDNPTSRIPPTNPFVGNTAYLPEIWSLGLRNPWRWSFDRQTGDLWIADVGQNAWEEVHFTPASSTGGENYGWKIMEGNVCYSTAACLATVPACNSPLLELPVWTYGHGSGCSITGGYRYRGCAIPDLDGWYFCADYCSSTIWSLRFNGTAVTQVVNRTAELAPSGASITSITSFGEDWDGELLIVSAAGTVWKVVPRGGSPARDLGFGTVGGNGLIPRYEVCGLLTAGNSAECWLRNAAPNAPAAVLFSSQNNPTNIAPFGTVVPFPIDFSLVFSTNAAGESTFTIPGGLPSSTLFSQWAVIDGGSASGIALSNAVAITYP
jgi:glucose/arabinose dehydrogenase